jgi:site-specific recombinase XerD
MQTVKLHSWLSDQICRFIELRRLSGTDYRSQAKLLGYFDRFLVKEHLSGPPVTRQIIDQYFQSFSHLRSRVQYNRFSVVRQLCEYIAQTDPCCYIPEPMKSVSTQKTHRPYIFRKSEIEALLSAASALLPPNSLRPHTYHTLLGLLYTTGIRVGEASGLALKDFHSQENLLYIAKGKFRKARWVPLHPSVSQVLERYVHKRLQSGPRSADLPLFINRRAQGLHYGTVHHTFRQLLKQCGIIHNKETGPRIHDLRHTFAVHRLLAWYRDGQDVNARLPALATYMGHVNVNSTQVYLKPTAELLEQVNTRFRNHYLQKVKPQGGR